MSWESRVYHPADLITEHWQAIKARWGQKKDLSISFLPELDNKIWGLKRKSLVVVAGRPSMGKSTLMLQMAYSFAAEGKKVYFFSLEMTKEECLERLICNYCSIDNYNVHTGKIDGDEFNDKIACFHQVLSDMKLMIVESWGRSFNEILEVIDNFQEPDAVFIDYVNMIRQGSLSKKSAIDEYIKDLRRLALDKNFCAILGAQINRDIHRNQEPGKDVPIPNMWNLKDTGNLEEHSDLVLIVHWPHYYRYLIEGGNSDDGKEYFIKVAKNRSGRTGIFECDFLPEYYRITGGEKPADLDNRGTD